MKSARIGPVRCASRRGRSTDPRPSFPPAGWRSVPRLEELHPSQLGVTPKTFANHRANVRAALNLFCAEKNVPRRGTPLSEPWSGLWASINRLSIRKQLSRFFRYLSANGISPEAIDDAVVEAFLADWQKTGLKGPNAQSRRRLVRAWNNCSETIPEWPVQRLGQSAVRSVARGPEWEAFPPDCAMRWTPFSPRRRRRSFRCRTRPREPGADDAPCHPFETSGLRAYGGAARRRDRNARFAVGAA